MSGRLFLVGASLVLPDRIATGRTIVIEDGRIADLIDRPGIAAPTDVRFDLPGHFIVPGFVDVHVHGVGGHDVLDGADALALVAASLPQYGVTKKGTAATGKSLRCLTSCGLQRASAISPFTKCSQAKPLKQVNILSKNVCSRT